VLARLHLQQSESVVQEACAEFEVACSEVNLQQQLEDLEALVLQRGLLGDANRSVLWRPFVGSAVHQCSRQAISPRVSVE
jgi:hypothetical protein